MAVTIPLIAADGARSTITLPVPSVTYRLGVQTIPAGSSSASADNIFSQGSYTLARAATVTQLSLRVNAGEGAIRLGIFDAAGAGGAARNRKAMTAPFVPAASGWITKPVIAPVTLPAGKYWIVVHVAQPTTLPALTGELVATESVGSVPFASGIPALFPTTVTPMTSRQISAYASLASAAG